MFLYSILLCKKIARASGSHKKFMLTKLGGGGRNRIDPIFPSIHIYRLDNPSTQIFGVFFYRILSKSYGYI